MPFASASTVGLPFRPNVDSRIGATAMSLGLGSSAQTPMSESLLCARSIERTATETSVSRNLAWIQEAPQPPTIRAGELTPSLRRMPARVEQNVGESVSHLARSPQGAHVIAIREHRTRATKHAIDGSGEPRSDRLHPAPEGALVVCLHDQMSVIPLERIVDEPEPLAITRGGERTFDLANHPYRAKRGNVVPHPKRDVAWKPIADQPARPVPDARIRTGLPARSGPSPAVAQSIEIELFRVSHRCVE